MPGGGQRSIRYMSQRSVSLIQLHALAGDRAAAARQYQECVKVLQAELGIEPERETTALFAAIRGGTTGQLAPALPLSLSPTPAHNLPSDPTPFIGREAELAQIAARMADPACRLLTILGPGGMGKTRLAIQAARDQNEIHTNGVVFVDLTSVLGPERLPSVILQALSVTGQGAVDTQAELLRFLRDRHVLLVLDNFEHLVEGGATLLSAMLRGAPKVKLLVTSRVRLNLREEWLAPLEGLEAPALEHEGAKEPHSGAGEEREARSDAHESSRFASFEGLRTFAVQPTALEGYSATALFLACVRRLRPDFQLTAEDARQIAHICRLLDGLPLAIELAAARARTMPLERIALELEHGLHFLTTTMRDLPQRHHSMTAALDHSWRLLSERERRVLRQLWVFRGGFNADAAEAVVEATPTDLEALADASWLRLTSDGRYALHELTRQYCEEKSTDGREAHATERAEQTRDHHAAYYRALLEVRAPLFYRQRTLVTETAQEMDNLLAAWDWTLARDDLNGLWAMARSLSYIARHQAWHHSMIQVLEASERMLRERVPVSYETPGMSSRDLMRATLWVLQADLYGNQYGSLGLWDRAKACVANAKSLLASIDSSDARYLETTWLLQEVEGWLAFVLGDFARGQSLFQALLSGIGTECANVWPYNEDAGRLARANVSVSLGYTFIGMGRAEDAQVCAQPVIALAEQIGAELLKARAAGLLALALHREGDYVQAEKWGLIHLELLRAGGDHAEIAFALYFLGALYQYWGKYERARSYLQQCLAVAQATGMYHDIVLGLIGLGNVALDMGDLAQARQQYKQALERCRQSETTGASALANSLIGLGSVALAEGDLASARRYFWEVLREIRPSLAVTARALAGAARVLLGEGRLLQAVEVCAFLLEWPATEYATKQKVEQVLRDLETRLPPEVCAAAITRGQSRQIDDVVTELVAK
jgi:predicted ATPase